MVVAVAAVLVPLGEDGAGRRRPAGWSAPASPSRRAPACRGSRPSRWRPPAGPPPSPRPGSGRRSPGCCRRASRRGRRHARSRRAPPASRPSTEWQRTLGQQAPAAPRGSRRGSSRWRASRPRSGAAAPARPSRRAACSSAQIHRQRMRLGVPAEAADEQDDEVVGGDAQPLRARLRAPAARPRAGIEGGAVDAERDHRQQRRGERVAPSRSRQPVGRSCRAPARPCAAPRARCRSARPTARPARSAARRSCPSPGGWRWCG